MIQDPGGKSEPQAVEVITLTVFVPFAVIYMREPIKLDYIWAALCLVGAVHFVFRSHQ